MSDKEKAQQAKALGNKAFQEGRFQEAVKFFSEAIKCDPSDHVLYSNRSGAYASLEDYQLALQDADSCVELNRSWAKGWSRKALAEHFLGKYDESESSYMKGLELDPGNAAMREGLQKVMDAKREARKPKGKGMGLNPTVLLGLLKQAPFNEYMKDDKFKQALNDLFSKGTLNPQNADKRIMELVVAALSQGDTGDFEMGGAELGGATGSASSTASSSSKPEPPTISEKERKEMEKKEREEKMTSEERTAEMHKERGNDLYKKKQFAEALEEYDKALSINPNEIAYQTNKASVYLEMGEYEKCLSECQNVIDRRYDVKADYAKVAKAYCRMGACLTRMKRFDEACKAYERALVEDNNRQTRNLLSEVTRMKEKAEADAYINPELAEEHKERGNEFFKQNDFPKAKREYDEAIKRNPKDAKLYCNRAACYTKLLEYPSALADCEKSIALDPKYTKAYSRKGTCHFFMKEYHKAISAYQEGLKVDPENKELKDGLESTLYKVNENQASDKPDAEQVKHAMADPEIQAILRDPQFNIVLSNMQENPAAASDAMKDPKIAAGISKLVAAGILKIGGR